jgi:hypothetical protein
MAEHKPTAHKTINTPANIRELKKKPKHIFIRDETKMEQTQSDKLQSAGEERAVNIANINSLL